MAGITHIRAGNMCGTLTAGQHAIVAGNTVIDEGGMIHRRGYPGRGTMAGITFIGGLNMIGMFTRRHYSIVT